MADSSKPSSSETFRSLFKRWVITTLAVAFLVASRMVDGIRYDNLEALLLATLSLSLLNLFIRPVLLLLSLPLLLLTLGLFTWVINAGLLLFVGRLISGFHVDDFGSAMWGALVISVISVVLNVLTGGTRVKASFVAAPSGGAGPSAGRRKIDSDGDGPVIDV
jgi:putative membrane protein